MMAQSDLPNRLLRAALAYAGFGWQVFPLMPGKKEPAIKGGFKAASVDPDQIRAWWEKNPSYNIGIRTGSGSGVMVLDVDCKELDGEAELSRLIAAHGPLPETPWQWTGQGEHGRGKQFFFCWFEGARNTAGSKGGLAPGIDTRGEGGYVVAAPSLHPSGVHYQWEAKPSRTPLAQAPTWLINWFAQRAAARAAPLVLEPHSRPDWSSIPDAYVRGALTREYNEMSGQGRGGRNARLNAGAYALGQLVAAGALSRSEAERCVRAAAEANGWARESGPALVEAMICSGLEAGMAKPRAAPQPLKELRGKASKSAPRSAWQAAIPSIRLVHSTSGSASHTQGLAQERTQPEQIASSNFQLQHSDWREDLIHNQDGGLAKQSFHNAVLILENHPDTAGLFVFDEFMSCIAMTRKPLWCFNGYEPGPLSDADINGCRLWLERQNSRMTKNDTFSAIEYVSAQHHVHPVRDYLRGLQWDGISRLPSWLSTYLQAADTALHSVFGTKWMVGAVARVMQPGCKMDTMLILEGQQGIKKSAALRVLAQMDGRDFFTDELASLGTKDSAQQLQGNLIIELAELDALDRAEIKTIKAFLTRQVDKVRLPYARTVSTLRRSCVFAGTVNPDGSGYLRDSTGARRFWPVAVANIDLEGLRCDRAQLWAEAVARYDAGENWWIEEESILADARAAQDDRREEDPLSELLVDFLRRHEMFGVTCAQVLADAWNFDEKNRTPAAARRAGAALRTLGWADRLVRDKASGKPRRCFFPPNHPSLKDHPARSES